MKSTSLLLATLAVALPLAMKAANLNPSPAPQTEVVFVDPAKFTDVRDSYTSSDRGRDYILEELRNYIIARSARFIPQGDKLFISVTDVDLAGDFEPWRRYQWDEVRIVKDIYPPRMAFSFRLTDAAGHVIKEGERDIRDMGFMMRASTMDNDPRRYEKELINDWLFDEFHDLKKK